jgi:hypothetical protein
MKTNVRKFWVTAATVAGVVGFGSLAMAAPILPGGVQAPAVPEPDPVNATLVQTTGPVAFASPTYSGTLTSSVFANDASNPFGPNGLTFTYQLVNNPGQTNDSIGRMTIASFLGFNTDASFNPTLPVGGVAPSSIDRSNSGAVMGFSWLTGLDPNSASAVLVVQTNSTQFNPTFASIIDGTTTQVASLAPLPIPEPASLAVLGLGALAVVRRRRA